MHISFDGGYFYPPLLERFYTVLLYCRIQCHQRLIVRVCNNRSADGGPMKTRGVRVRGDCKEQTITMGLTDTSSRFLLLGELFRYYDIVL